MLAFRPASSSRLASRTMWLPPSQQLHGTVTLALVCSPLWLFWDMGFCETGSQPLQVRSAANTNHVWASTPAAMVFALDSMSPFPPPQADV